MWRNAKGEKKMSVLTEKGKVSRNAREAVREDVLSKIDLDLEPTNVGTFSTPITVNGETIYTEISIVVTERDPMLKVRTPRKAKEQDEAEAEEFVIE
jgi:hypothetical protein